MKYSIITINLNNRKGLRKTIESVVSQTYKDYEYIVIDGGSTDGSEEVVKEYENRVSYWVSEPDNGIYNAMNKGIFQARGEYLIFMNSGDEFYDKNVLQSIVSMLDKDIVVGKVMHGTEIWGFQKEEITMLDLVQGTIMHQASFIHRRLFEINKYDEAYKIVSDWKFYVESLILGNATFRNIELVICKFAPGGVSETDIKKRAWERNEVYRELFPERIMKDYFRLAKADSPLLELIPHLNKTYRLNKLAYKIVYGLVKANDFILHVKQKLWLTN